MDADVPGVGFAALENAHRVALPRFQVGRHLLPACLPNGQGDGLSVVDDDRHIMKIPFFIGGGRQVNRQLRPLKGESYPRGAVAEAEGPLIRRHMVPPYQRHRLTRHLKLIGFQGNLPFLQRRLRSRCRAIGLRGAASAFRRPAARRQHRQKTDQEQHRRSRFHRFFHRPSRLPAAPVSSPAR